RLQGDWSSDVCSSDLWWFRFIEDKRLAETHLLSTDVDDLPADGLTPECRENLRGRVTICRGCEVIPVECVVRGYLEGSGWKEYQIGRASCREGGWVGG